MKNLTEISNTLNDIPEARVITMALRYYDEVTPPDYEPRFFIGADENALRNFACADGHKTLKVKIARVCSPFHQLKLLLETAYFDWDNSEDSTNLLRDSAVPDSAAPPADDDAQQHARDESDDISESGEVRREVLRHRLVFLRSPVLTSSPAPHEHVRKHVGGSVHEAHYVSDASSLRHRNARVGKDDRNICAHGTRWWGRRAAAAWWATGRGMVARGALWDGGGWGAYSEPTPQDADAHGDGCRRRQPRRPR